MNKESVKVPKSVAYFIETAFGDKSVAIQHLILASTGDDYPIDEEYREWLKNEKVHISVNEYGIIAIQKWVEQIPIKDLLNLVNGYEVEEDE